MADPHGNPVGKGSWELLISLKYLMFTQHINRPDLFVSPRTSFPVPTEPTQRRKALSVRSLVTTGRHTKISAHPKD